jgi:hypothetical protein
LIKVTYPSNPSIQYKPHDTSPTNKPINPKSYMKKLHALINARVTENKVCSKFTGACIDLELGNFS